MSKIHEKEVKQIQRFLAHEHKEDAQALCVYADSSPWFGPADQVIYSLQSAKGIICGGFFMRQKQWNPFFMSWRFSRHKFLPSAHITPADLLAGLGFHQETIFEVPERRRRIEHLIDAGTSLLYFRTGEREKLVVDPVVNYWDYANKFAGQFNCQRQ